MQTERGNSLLNVAAAHLESHSVGMEIRSRCVWHVTRNGSRNPLLRFGP